MLPTHYHHHHQAQTQQQNQSSFLNRKIKSNRWFLKRKRLVILAIILCSFFLLHQIISLMQLDWDISNLIKSNLNKLNSLDEEKLEEDWLLEKERLKTQLTKNVAETSSHTFIMNNNKNNYDAIENLPGVLEQRKHFYLRNASNTFKCIFSGELIDFSMINDDYCDCNDGTDEPSTSACQDNKFYCKVKSFTGQLEIRSSQVNDGICDCCDGSDEWLNKNLPFKLNSIQMNAIKKSETNIRLTPCNYHC